jgi:flagellar biosynthesis chaperone FliJ
VKDALVRLLRLRSLLEDVSRLELEMCLHELAQIESGMDELAEGKRENRQHSFLGFSQSENSSWIEAEACIELAVWQEQVLAGVREKKEAEVDAAKAAFLERRKETCQVESVVDSRAAQQSIVRSRREQRALDDWFNQKKS